MHLPHCYFMFHRRYFTKVAYFQRTVITHHFRTQGKWQQYCSCLTSLPICHVFVIDCRKLKIMALRSSNDSTFVPCLVKFGQLVYKQTGGTQFVQTSTHRGNLVSLVTFLFVMESRLQTVTKFDVTHFQKGYFFLIIVAYTVMTRFPETSFVIWGCIT